MDPNALASLLKALLVPRDTQPESWLERVLRGLIALFVRDARPMCTCLCTEAIQNRPAGEYVPSRTSDTLWKRCT